MPRDATRYRLSILAFDDEERLWQAVRTLFSEGVTADQLCLFGLPDTLERLQPPVPPPDGNSQDLERLMTSSATRLALDGGTGLAARCGNEIAHLIEWREPGAGRFHWMQEALAKKLAHQTAAGAVALLVSAADPKQHERCARVLLRCGRHSLQTHEFWWPGAAADH